LAAASESAVSPMQLRGITEPLSGTRRAMPAEMSRPRQVLPGSTYLVTRRTLRRHFLFRPDAEMNGLIVYLLAVSAQRSGILVHGFCAMSTHVHLVVTDTRGELPAFLEYFHRLLALTTKVLRKWEGAVLDHEQTSVVRLETNEAITNKIGYVLANPVEAGLVRYARDWPGAKSHPNDLGGGTMTATRPDVDLDAARWPETAELALALPLGVEDHEAGAWRAAVKESIADHEARGQAEVERKGWRFLGAERAQRVSPYDRATSYEAIRGRNPTFAVSGVAGAYAAAVRALREFRRAYAEARARWRAGFRDVVFPAGTWWMVRGHSAVVAAPP